MAWTHELERHLLAALRSAYASFNRDLFGGGLIAPVFVLDDSTARLGHWRRGERILGISRPLARTKPWHVVRAVLKHEMAHQYVDEVLGVHDETAHGPAFARVCSELHIDARASGIPEGDAGDAGDALDDVDDDRARVMRRVQKLLALAQSDNENEAESAARAAQRLMLEHNVQHNLEKRGVRRYATRRLTPPMVRLPAHIKMLSGVLSRYFFVEVVLARAYLPDAGKDGFLVEVSGSSENLAMAEWVFGFLCDAGERVWQAQRRQGAVASGSRLRFLAGFISGVDDKLARERTVQASQGLVWLGDADLHQWVRREHPRLRATRVRTPVDDAHLRGRAAGNDVVLSRPMAAPEGQRGRLLR